VESVRQNGRFKTQTGKSPQEKGRKKGPLGWLGAKVADERTIKRRGRGINCGKRANVKTRRGRKRADL